MLFSEIICFYCGHCVLGCVGRRQPFCGKVGGAYIYRSFGWVLRGWNVWSDTCGTGEHTSRWINWSPQLVAVSLPRHSQAAVSSMQRNVHSSYSRQQIPNWIPRQSASPSSMPLSGNDLYKWKTAYIKFEAGQHLLTDCRKSTKLLLSRMTPALFVSGTVEVPREDSNRRRLVTQPNALICTAELKEDNKVH